MGVIGTTSIRNGEPVGKQNFLRVDSVKRLKHILYVGQRVQPDVVEKLEHLLAEIQIKKRIPFEIIQWHLLTTQEQHKILSELREKKPKTIRIRSSGSGALPISRSGRFNQTIPVLVIKAGNDIIDIRPHASGPRNVYRSIEEYLLNLLGMKPQKQEVVSEQEILMLIKKYPELIEKGLRYEGSEVDVGAGRIDAVFRDRNGNPLLIEIEIEVTDKAIGQVTKFLPAYSRLYNVKEEQIRLGLVCFYIPDGLIDACRSKNIEVYRITAEKLT